MHELPDGFQPLKYISRRPPTQPQMYVLDGFQTEESANLRIAELHSTCPSDKYSVLAKTAQVVESYAVLLPDTAAHLLSETERNRLVATPIEIPHMEYHPYLYRFIDEGEKDYVDEFFATGKLMLTTFKRCAELENPDRKDTNEGYADLIGYDGALTCEIGMGVGADAIMLCTTLSKNNVKRNGDQYKNCIAITDVDQFTKCITLKLLQQGIPIKTVLKGPCVYSDRKIERALPEGMLRRFLDSTKSGNFIDFNEMFDMGEIIGQDDMFFSKSIDNAFENEYRMVWLLDGNVEKDRYFVEIPEAVKLCRKITFN